MRSPAPLIGARLYARKLWNRLMAPLFLPGAQPLAHAAEAMRLPSCAIMNDAGGADGGEFGGESRRWARVCGGAELPKAGAAKLEGRHV